MKFAICALLLTLGLVQSALAEDLEMSRDFKMDDGSVVCSVYAVDKDRMPIDDRFQPKSPNQKYVVWFDFFDGPHGSSHALTAPMSLDQAKRALYSLEACVPPK